MKHTTTLNTLGILYLIGLTLSGCKDRDWGTRALRYARNEARTDSVETATRDLKLRWTEAHRASALSLVARLDFVRQRLLEKREQSEPLPVCEPMEPCVETLKGIYANLSTLTDTESLIDHLASGLDLWRESCGSRQMFYGLGLDRLGLEFPLMKLPKPNYSVGLSNDLGKSLEYLFLSVKDFFDSSEVKEQNRKFHEATEVIRRVSIQGQELFEKSRSICEAEAAPFARNQEGIAASIDELRAAVSSLRHLALARRSLIESRLMPAKMRRILEKDGVLAQIIERDRVLQSQKLRFDILTAMQHIGRLREEWMSQSSPEQKLAIAESLTDSVRAVRSQLQSILEQATPDSELESLTKQTLDLLDHDFHEFGGTG